MSTGMALPRALLTGLLDDAAVFPPGNAPLTRAVADHRGRTRRHPWADLVGPLLVPVVSATELPRALRLTDGAVVDGEGVPPLPVVLVARPGTALGLLAEAVEHLRTQPGSRVVGVELVHQSGWQEALGWRLPVVVELHRCPEARAESLAQVAAAAARGGDVRVKLRTQSSPVGPVPAAPEVAAFLADAHVAGLPAKLTGGLHHAVAATVGSPGGAEEQHGLLNVLLAAARTVAGTSPEDAVTLLTERDGVRLAAAAADLDHAQAVQARQLLTSVGCCGVLEPLTELADLGLLPRDLEPHRQEHS